MGCRVFRSGRKVSKIAKFACPIVGKAIPRGSNQFVVTGQAPAIILGIETSCDETAAALVLRDESGRATIRSNVVRSQLDEHAAFGGVVPELAARAHVTYLDHIIAQACNEAGVTLDQVDAIAATAGPGLIGGVNRSS